MPQVYFLFFLTKKDGISTLHGIKFPDNSRHLDLVTSGTLGP